MKNNLCLNNPQFKFIISDNSNVDQVYAAKQTEN